MTYEITLSPSKKAGLNSKDGYKITRGGTIFLRLLGSASYYELMTATAGEDNGRFPVFGNKMQLIEAAMQTAADFNFQPLVENDFLQREYVKICAFEGLEDKDLEPIVERFFEHLDKYEPLQQRGNNEMVDLYETLRIDDIGSDVYLSDGVWLSSDGSLHDRGR